MEFAAILVIYNRYAGDSEAGQSLARCAPTGTRVLLFDNSTQEFGNCSFCASHGWTYLGDGCNHGLSRAYNACIDLLKREGFFGLVCLFDDDTQVTADYFASVESAASERTDCAAFFPLLRAGGRIVSPQIIRPNQHASFFESAEDCLSYTGADLFAFNSGMAVRSEVFDRVSYCQDLFLDGIDYAFLRDCVRSGFCFAAFPAELKHGFSGAQHPDYPTALSRFENYARDHSVVLRDNPGGYRYLVGKRALHLSLIYHKTTFLHVFLRHRPGRKTETHE